MRDDSTPPPEEWCPVIGYEGIYEVSSLGRVRRLTNKNGGKAGQMMAICHPPSTDYPYVSLSRDNRCRRFLLHRVVAESFLGPCPPGMEVNHKDLNKRNPVSSNLEYLTSSQNTLHAYANGVKAACGTQKPIAKLTEAQVRDIRRSPLGNPVLARQYGVSEQTICGIRKWRTWKHVQIEVES